MLERSIDEKNYIDKLFNNLIAENKIRISIQLNKTHFFSSLNVMPLNIPKTHPHTNLIRR